MNNEAMPGRVAEHVRTTYSWEKIEKRDVTEPVVVEDEYGFRALSLPREQMFEPYRSLRLIDAVAVGPVVAILFAWGPPVPEQDDHIFLLPLDTREFAFDPADEHSMVTAVSHHLEFTLGTSKERWQPERAVQVSDRLSLVRPWRPDRGGG